jgi:hypothetical protein
MTPVKPSSLQATPAVTHPVRPDAPRHPLVVRIVTVLTAWLVAFLIVLTLLVTFGSELESLPPALKAFVFTGILVPIMGHLVMPKLSVAVAMALRGTRIVAPPRDVAHAQLDVLPEWPPRTIGVLVTADSDSIHAIPISAPVRAADRRVLLSLHRTRGSLARLRECPEIAVVVLAEGDVAMTARGRAHVVREAMTCAPEYSAIALDVHHIDDHRQSGSSVTSGIDRRWLDESERDSSGRRVLELRGLAGVVERRDRDPC